MEFHYHERSKSAPLNREPYGLRQAVVSEAKRNKWKWTVSLATLEEIGLAEQPSPEDSAAAPTRYVKEHLALHAQRSLYIRLLVYRPLCNRNLCEMKINDNLYCNGRGWMVEFKINEEFKKTVFEYTEHAMKLHLVRNVWASEYFAAENDVTVAAQMLGDTVETVLRHYVEPLRKQITEVADRFVRKAKVICCAALYRRFKDGQRSA
jgi:hypothetical protein